MILRTLAACLLLALPGFAGQQLAVVLRPVFGDKELTFDQFAFHTSAGQHVSVTRCDLLLSCAALQRPDGTWLSSSSWSSFLSLRNERSSFALHNIPAGQYQKIRFHIGLPEALNFSDAAAYPAKHPLNPLVNGLHRNRQDGYVFAAIEGLWRDQDDTLRGYSFHIARNDHLITVELPAQLDLTSDQTLHLDIDLLAVFQGIWLEDSRSATHSRPADRLADTVSNNLTGALQVAEVNATPPHQAAPAVPDAVVSPKADAYRLTFADNFPRPSLPVDNPLTEEGVALGERLFRDRRLSGNQTQSCASCHARPDALSDHRRFSIGAFGDRGTRQSMPLFNLAWKSSYFWDGRAATLREQSLEPIQNPIEMHASLDEVVKHLQSDRDYPRQFQAAFGTREISADRLARALEQFLITLVSDESKFDRAQRGLVQLSEEEKRGAELFNTEYDPQRGLRGGDCFNCHGGVMFKNVDFANNGLDTNFTDAGHFKATQRESDRGKFAVPSLRNVALTAPYMHDGRFATLEEVIEHYDHGVQRSETLDPNLARHPDAGLQLSKDDKAALVAFLKTLTDREFVRPPNRRGPGLPPDVDLPPNMDHPPGPHFPPPPRPPGPPRR